MRFPTVAVIALMRALNAAGASAGWRRASRLVVALSLLACAVGAGGCETFIRRDDIAARVDSARTADDHAAIARSLLARADRYSSDARRHHELAARYEESGWWLRLRHHDSSELRMAEHCRRVAANLDGAAAELREIAREHETLSREMVGKPGND